MLTEEEIIKVNNFLKNDTTEFYHDEPNSDSELFEFSWLAGALSDIIIRQIDTPFAISLDGEWGSGKTSLLSKTRTILNKKIDEKNKKVDNKKMEEREKFVVIWFDAWDYEKVDAVSGLLYKIQDELPEDEVNKFKERAMQFGSLLFDIAVRRYTNIPLEEVKNHFKSTIQAITTIRDDLQSLLRDKNIRLIVFVDDLDRCSFETMVGITESIKIFLNSKRVIFIIAADNEKLQLAWKNRYPLFRESEAHDYFDKFFQLKIKLPLKGTTHIEDYLKNINSFLPKKLETLLIKSLDNPRKIKQILNKIFFLLKYNNVLNGKSNQEIGDYLTAITIWSIIITSFPELSRQISKNMISLLDILVIINHFKNFEILELSYERVIGKYNAIHTDPSAGAEGAIISRFLIPTRSCLDLIIKNRKIYDLFDTISDMFELESISKDDINNYTGQRQNRMISDTLSLPYEDKVHDLLDSKFVDPGERNSILKYYTSFPQKYKLLYALLVDVIKLAKILYS